VDNDVAKVLHATQLKFHAHRLRNTTSKALAHSATGSTRHFAFWHAACTSHGNQAVKFLPEGVFMKNYFIRGSVLALTLGVASMGSLYAQEAKPAQNDPQAQPTQSQPAQNNAQASPTSAQSAKEFTGTIVKEKGAMMLKDGASNVSYKVDDESKVKDYEGKQVKVTGTLDSSTNVIHVDSIQVIS
jgi:uncharacterized protein DUF5818